MKLFVLLLCRAHTICKGVVSTACVEGRSGHYSKSLTAPFFFLYFLLRSGHVILLCTVCVLISTTFCCENKWKKEKVIKAIRSTLLFILFSLSHRFLSTKYIYLTTHCSFNEWSLQELCHPIIRSDKTLSHSVKSLKAVKVRHLFPFRYW